MRLLVVDDDVHVLRATERGLRIHGHEVVTANSGTEALDLIRRLGQRFEAIVSDLEMPGMHGDKLCEEVQKIVPTPFILVSGNATVFERASMCGAAASFLKPVTPSDLKDALAQLISKTAVA